MGKIRIEKLTLLLFLLSFPLQASENIFFLGETQQVVTITRTPLPFWASPSRTLIITHRDIQQNGFLTLNDLLENLPDFYIQEGAFQTTIFTEGLKEGILILLDGVPVSAGLHSTLTLSGYEIPLNYIKKIEILKGPFTTLWGFNAWGGVINLVTLKGMLKKEGEVTLSSNGYNRGLITYSYNRGNLQAYFSLSYLQGKTENRDSGAYPVLIKPGGELASPGKIVEKSYLTPVDSTDKFFSFFSKFTSKLLEGEIFITDFKSNYPLSPFSSMLLKLPGKRSTPTIITTVKREITLKKLKINGNLFFEKREFDNSFPLFSKTSLTPIESTIFQSGNSETGGIDLFAYYPVSKYFKMSGGVLESINMGTSLIEGYGINENQRKKIIEIDQTFWTHSIYLQGNYIHNSFGTLFGMRFHKEGTYKPVVSGFISLNKKWREGNGKLLYGIAYRTPEKIDYSLLGIALIKQQVENLSDEATSPEELATFSLNLNQKWKLLNANLSITKNSVLKIITNEVSNGTFKIINQKGDKWFSFLFTVSGNYHFFSAMIWGNYITRKNEEIPHLKTGFSLAIAGNSYRFSFYSNYYSKFGTTIKPYFLADTSVFLQTGKLSHTVIIKNIFNQKYRVPSAAYPLTGYGREIRYTLSFQW